MDKLHEYLQRSESQREIARLRYEASIGRLVRKENATQRLLEALTPHQQTLEDVLVDYDIHEWSTGTKTFGYNVFLYGNVSALRAFVENQLEAPINKKAATRTADDLYALWQNDIRIYVKAAK